jgi:hypothetical protein
MQVLPASGVPQPAPSTAPTATPAVGPATPAAPLEPERRVTANRPGGRGDLEPQQQLQKSATPKSRGRLLDLFV